MSKDPIKTSGAFLFGLFLIGGIAGATIYYFAGPKCPEPGEPALKLEFVGVYDADNLRSMMGGDPWGVRFYLASDDAGHFSSVAVPIQDDGQHIADDSGDLRFRMYKSMSGDATDMAMLGDADAETYVKRSGTESKPAWCMEARIAAVRELLAVAGCNGIGVLERNTSLDDWTFDLVPVKIDEGNAMPVGGISDMRVGAPCPNFCGRDASYYLHTR